MNDSEKLNQLGETWYNMPEQGNEAARLALLEKIFGLVYELFPKREDIIAQFFISDWPKFDPNKGTLYDFFHYRLKNRKKDADKQDFDGAWTEEHDEISGKKQRVKKRHTSLDIPVGDDGGTSLKDGFLGAINVDDSRLIINEAVLELMTLMLDLKSRLGGKAGNPVRINYFRLFFTDGVVDAIQDCQVVNAFGRRERDLFRVIKETFLNYFMCSPCSSVEDILSTDLKLHGQMVEGQPMEPAERPLQLDVYTTYLEQVEHYTVKESAVSQQRTAYKAFMKAQFLC